MNLLRTYLMWSVWKGVATALAVIVGVVACIEVVGQLDDVGTGDFGLAQALAYVVLRLPRTIFETLPAAALIGSLLSLGNLAVHRELIVMRASGVSPAQLLGSVGLAGIGLAVVMVLLGESLAPSLGAYASELRTRTMHEEVDIEDGQSTWLKEGDRIVNLRRHAGDVDYGGGVLLFELGPGHALRGIVQAESASIDASNRWVLANYGETRFNESGVVARKEREVTEDYGLDSELLALSVVRHDLLDTPALQRYIGYLRANGLDSRRYEIAYWARIATMVSVVPMTVLALPFVFGGLRSAGAGARLVVGLVIGLGYYVLGQVLENSGEVFDLEPLVVAWAPSALLLAVTVVAARRVR
jgi:lipopolysaccharide export system permease protein